MPSRCPDAQTIISFLIIGVFAVAYFVHYDAEMNDALVTGFVAVVGYSIGAASGARRAAEEKK